MKIPSITLPSSAALTSGLGDAFKTMADTLLSGIPYTQHARLLTLKTAQASNLTDTLVVESFTGHEAINQLFCFDVQALSISASVDCQQFIGEEISLRLLQVDGSYRAWHGYCTQAAFLGADGGFSRYALRLEPFLAFLKHRHNAVVFQDKNAQEIISTLLAAYPESTLRWDVTQALPTYPLRTQYRESDFDFFRRILAEVGLSWRFEHEQERQDAQPFAAANGSGNAADDESDSLQHSKHAKHTLVIFDSKAAIPVLPQQSHLRYHGIRATDKEDAIDTFSAERQVAANAVSVSSWDYKQLQATAAEQTAALSALERETLPLLQVYHGNGAQRFANDAAAEAMAERVLQGLALHSQGFVGQGSVRQLAAGFGFSLTQHEQLGVSALHSIDSGDAADAGAGAGAGHYTVLSVTHQGWNNLSAAHNAMQNATLSAGVTDLTAHGERGTYRNHFTCVR
ncbi:MAG: type VI secretion system Vgr family protein, partial [Burkholderiaceae bacterium]|nr:type VI secretion system Vgr family protein [Burkholderiaceae bacterium]